MEAECPKVDFKQYFCVEDTISQVKYQRDYVPEFVLNHDLQNTYH